MAISQVIEGQYIDRSALLRLLRRRFQNQFIVRLQLDAWVITAPECLTEDEIDSCTIYNKLQDQFPVKIASESSLQVQQAHIYPQKIRVPADPIDSKSEGSYTVEIGLGSLDVNLVDGGISGYLYAANARLYKGTTSEVFGVVARMSWVSKSGTEKQVERTEKIAIKRLQKGTSPAAFLREYEILRGVKKMDHPNIVRILKAFSDEKDHVVVYNFIFPLAIGNLKELFLADLGKETSVSKLVSTLWLQFEGLGSGVSHLHENGIAHRDIKPSNVLLYQDSSPSRLTAKIADFGLAVGTQDNPKFEVGSVDAKSALKYADPEMRTRSSGPETSQNPPTREELWKADIWTLGAVYTEMLSYLVRGPTGVTEFRNFITTTKNNLTSDQISDSMYDDGIKVKAQVLEWLNTLANWENRAGEIVPLIQSMLNESSKRPTASIVVERLSNVSFNVVTDGVRLVRFTPWTHVPKPGYTDSWKVRLEEKLGAPIDWKPFASVKRACSPGMTRVLWEWYDEWLEMDLPQDKAEQYRKSCKPLSQITAQDRGHPVESFDGSGSTIAPEHPNAPTSTQGDLSSASSSTTGPSSQALPLSRGAVPGTNHFREIYWCVDIPWSERRVTYLMALKVDGLSGNGEDGRICDDMTLCKVLLQSYNKIRGFRGTLLSWKTCVDLRFIKFARIYTDSAEVSGLKVELPPSKDYDYELISPDEVHMNIASKQILRGFSKREWGYHLTTTLSLIPKKKDSTLNFNMGSQGWGLHAIEGFSLTKILIWVAVLNGVGIAFVVLWLVFVSKTDLQNAFVPVTYFMTVILLGLAVPQLLGAA